MSIPQITYATTESNTGLDPAASSSSQTSTDRTASELGDTYTSSGASFRTESEPASPIVDTVSIGASSFSAEAPSARAEKLAWLQTAITNGTYNVPTSTLADKIISATLSDANAGALSPLSSSDLTQIN